MLVKICGITNIEDARTAADGGADFLGLAFVPGTKRYLTVARARLILEAGTGTATPVGLFRNADPATIVQTASALGLSTIQLHGDEPPGFIDDLAGRMPSLRVVKAFRIHGPESFRLMEAYYRQLRHPDRILAFLLDGPSGGGTGTGFDWRSAAGEIAKIRRNLPPIFLAGGLTVDNLVEAIKILEPDGVDVSSGVEAAPGRKDAGKVTDFIRLAKQRT
jgi:phosphoribosylanthranilate isomerase